MVDHDGGYKLLFGNQRMVEDLVRGFVPEPWVDRLDFSTLQRCEGSYVTEGSGRREADMVWRVRWEGEGKRGEGTGGEGSWLYVYLLLEFQSRVERFMAVRMLNYLSLLYLDLVKRRELTESGKLPPVLPLVLYNGERRWSAPRQVGELIETVPGGLTAYRPSLEDAQTMLRQRVIEWDRRVEELKEAGLREGLREGRQVGLQEGRQVGLQEGRQVGLQEGRQVGHRELLLRQMERKFGTVNPAARRRIEDAEDRQLLAWAETLLTAESLEDVFSS
jgi:hypothetical protein